MFLLVFFIHAVLLIHNYTDTDVHSFPTLSVALSSLGGSNPLVELVCQKYTEEEVSGATARHHHAYCCDYGGEF